MAEKPWQSAENLRSLYHDQELSLKNIADKYNIGKSTVRYWMDKLGVEKRPPGHPGGPYRNKKTLQKLYLNEGLSTVEIGERLGCDPTTVLRWLNRHDIPTRQASQEKPPHYSMNDRGYEFWRPRVGGTKKYVPVHRLAAVAWFGYDAVISKHAHHKNGIPWDNRESNLDLLSPSDHTSLHHKRGDIPISQLNG